MDFAVAGSVMREINRVIPYSNATVQGVRRTVKSAKQNPAAFAAKMMLFSILPTYLAREYNNSQGANEEYEKLPFWRRDMFYNLKVGDDNWLTIPKPFSTVIASAAFDRYMSQINGEKDMFKGFAGAAVQEIFPFGGELFTPVFKPTAEVLLNRDMFRMKTIVPPYEEQLELGKRTATEKASRLGNTVQNVVNASGLGSNYLAKRLLNARAVDHQMKGYLGNLGGIVVNASDYGRENRRGLQFGDLAGVVKGSPAYGSKDVEFIYDYAANKGISTLSKKLKPLKTAMDDYFDASSPEERQKRGDKVLEVAEKIRKGIEEKGEDYFGKRKKKKKKK